VLKDIFSISVSDLHSFYEDPDLDPDPAFVKKCRSADPDPIPDPDLNLGFKSANVF
jgi:hypothetical protein